MFVLTDDAVESLWGEKAARGIVLLDFVFEELGRLKHEDPVAFRAAMALSVPIREAHTLRASAWFLAGFTVAYALCRRQIEADELREIYDD